MASPSQSPGATEVTRLDAFAQELCDQPGSPRSAQAVAQVATIGQREVGQCARGIESLANGRTGAGLGDVYAQVGSAVAALKSAVVDQAAAKCRWGFGRTAVPDPNAAAAALSTLAACEDALTRAGATLAVDLTHLRGAADALAAVASRVRELEDAVGQRGTVADILAAVRARHLELAEHLTVTQQTLLALAAVRDQEADLLRAVSNSRAAAAAAVRAQAHADQSQAMVQATRDAVEHVQLTLARLAQAATAIPGAGQARLDAV